MTFNSIDVNSLTPFDRKQLLGFLRRKLGDNAFDGFLNDNGEEWMLQVAFFMMSEDLKQGKEVPVQLASTPRYQNGAPAVIVSNLERLRQHMGDNEYQKALARLGKPAMEEMANKMFGTRSSTTSNLRTRESSRKVAQLIFLISLAYGALLGAGYPDWVRFGQVFESIFYWVVGGVVILGLILIFIFNISFDFGNIWLYGLIIAASIASVIGLVANVFTLGIKVLGVAAVAFIACWLVGVLLGTPVFRLVERQEKTTPAVIIAIAAIIVGIGLMVLGWFGVLAIFPVN